MEEKAIANPIKYAAKAYSATCLSIRDKRKSMHPPPSNKTMESLNTFGLYSLYLRTK